MLNNKILALNARKPSKKTVTQRSVLVGCLQHNNRHKESFMHQGSVKWFNNAKGYGFIVSEAFDEDLFIHYSAIKIEGYKTLKAGQTVTFDVEPGDKGLHAIDITPLTPDPSSPNVTTSLS